MQRDCSVRCDLFQKGLVLRRWRREELEVFADLILERLEKFFALPIALEPHMRAQGCKTRIIAECSFPKDPRRPMLQETLDRAKPQSATKCPRSNLRVVIFSCSRPSQRSRNFTCGARRAPCRSSIETVDSQDLRRYEL